MYKLRSSGLGTTVSPGLGRVPMLVLVPPRLSSSRVFIPITKPTLVPASLRHQPLVTGWSRRNWRPGHSNPCRELLYICHHSHQSIGHTSGPDHTATCWSPQKSETNNRTCGDGWSQNHFIRHKIFNYTDEIVSDTVLLLTFTSKIRCICHILCTIGWEEALEHFFRRTAITSPDCQEFMVWRIFSGVTIFMDPLKEEFTLKCFKE